MANLTPTPGWDNVFQLETDTPVLGGAGGVANSQAQALLNRTSFIEGPTGSSKVGHTPAGTGAVATTVQAKLRRFVSVTDFGAVGDGSTDDTSNIQAAIDFCYENQLSLEFPAGDFVATGLVIPPAGFTSPDPRGFAFRMYGQGQGQIFAVADPQGTRLISTTNAPILTVTKFPTPGFGTTGNIYIDHIRFEGTSSTPVVQIDAFYGQSEFRQNGIFQRGTGDGLKVDYIATAKIEENYIINDDWNNFGPVVRTGCGIRFEQNFDGGLATFKKNTCRGFADGFIVGDGTNDPSAVRMEQNECSVVENGVTINANVSGCVLDNNYFEGVEGTCVLDNGNFTKVVNNFFYDGFAIGIDGSVTSTYGSLYQGNYIETSGGQPCTLIKVGSAGSFGGPNKTVTANHLLFSTSGGVVPGVIGIEKIGNNPRLNIFGNAFDPRGPWVGGAGTVKILNSTTGEGTYGLDFVSSGDYEFPHLAHGAISLGRNVNALTQANVSGSTLILPNDGSLFDVNASIATSVNVVDAGNHIDKIVILTLANTNMTLNKTGQLLLASNFSGPGTITLLTYYSGATKFAIEIARTTI